MRKLFLAIGAFVAMAGVAFANDNFVLYNETGHTITGFWCSPHNASRWHNQILRSALRTDWHVEIEINDSEYYGTDVYDFMVQYGNGSKSYYEEGVNLSAISKVTVTLDSDGVTTFDWE